MGMDQNFEDVMDNATVKYNNMVKQKIWTQTDPMDTKILALTTLNHEVHNSKKAGKSYTGAMTSGGGAEKKWVFTFDPWRIVKKKVPKNCRCQVHIIKEKENTTKCILHIRRISTTNRLKEKPVGTRRNLLLLPLHQYQQLLLQPRNSL